MALLAAVLTGLGAACHREASIPIMITPPGDPRAESMSRYIIRNMSVPHCKRGPQRCAECRKRGAARLVLLDIAPPDAGMVQRPVIQVISGAETLWREYDVVRSFADEAEARAYAAEHGIEDAEW